MLVMTVLRPQLGNVSQVSVQTNVETLVLASPSLSGSSFCNPELRDTLGDRTHGHAQRPAFLPTLLAVNPLSYSCSQNCGTVFRP